jgi:hypothetical protein
MLSGLLSQSVFLECRLSSAFVIRSQGGESIEVLCQWPRLSRGPSELEVNSNQFAQDRNEMGMRSGGQVIG